MDDGDRRLPQLTRSARARARGLAVAVALTAGVVATAATSPAPDPPCPESSLKISELFGQQDEDTGGERWQPTIWFEVGPFRGDVAAFTLQACIVDHLDSKNRAPVEVTVNVTDDGSGPGLEHFLRAVVLIDGRGREHTVTGIQIEDREGNTRNDLQVQEARLAFALPLDVPEPVVLQRPDLDGRSKEQGLLTIPLKPADPEESGEPADAETSPMPTATP